MKYGLFCCLFLVSAVLISCGKAARDEIAKSGSQDEFSISGSEWSLKVTEVKTKSDLAASLVIKEYSLSLLEKGRFQIIEVETKKLLVLGNYKYIQVKPSILFNIENSELDLFGKAGESKIYRLEKDGSETKLIHQDTYFKKLAMESKEEKEKNGSKDDKVVSDVSKEKVLGLWRCESKDVNASILLQKESFNLKITTNSLTNVLGTGEYSFDNGLVNFDIKESKEDSLFTSILELHVSKSDKAKLVFTEKADVKAKLANCEKINQSGG